MSHQNSSKLARWGLNALFKIHQTRSSMRRRRTFRFLRLIIHVINFSARSESVECFCIKRLISRVPFEFPAPEIQCQKGRADQERSADDGDRDVALAIHGGVGLFPNDQGEPRLHDVSHLIHGTDDNGAFFVVAGADFVGPPVGCVRLDVLGGSCLGKLILTRSKGRKVRC